jgi:hypothetical protein
MGRRYAAICDYLGFRWSGTDDGYKDVSLHDKSITHYIIATPTDHHLDAIIALEGYNKPILCEKPLQICNRETYPALEKTVKAIQNKQIYIVNNWQHFIDEQHSSTSVRNTIEYDYYHSGNDGLAWDCFQLFGLKNIENVILKNESPIWDVRLHCYKIHIPSFRLPRDRGHFDESYIDMIQAFINNDDWEDELWDMNKALEITKRVMEYEENH